MRKTSPKIIGLFVTGGLVLLVGMVIFFASTSWFTKSVHFILFFDQSVNGLSEGSKVKFRGVPVGSVSKIMIRAHGQDTASTAIPVVIQIDRARLVNDFGLEESALDPEEIRGAIQRGLFAQLSLESFITGQLFVELSVDAKRSPEMQSHLMGSSDLIEIPTVSSSLDQITADAAEIISQLSVVDFPLLEDNVNAVLENLATALAGIDSPGISRAVIGAADGVTAFVSSSELNRSVLAAQEAFDSLKSSLDSFNMKEGPLADTLAVWTSELSQALKGLNAVTGQISAMTEPEGVLRFELESTLRELSRTAKSIRELAEYLETNPNAVLTGRPEE